jgi:hypothetical protein
LQDKNHITSIDNFEKVGLEKKKGKRQLRVFERNRVCVVKGIFEILFLMSRELL